MADKMKESCLQEKNILLMRLSKEITTPDEYEQVTNIFQEIFACLPKAEKCEVDSAFLQSLDSLMTNAGQCLNSDIMQSHDLLTPMFSCVTSCLRVCRNLCALNKSNQTIFHDSQTYIQHILNFLSELQHRNDGTEDVVVLFRCAIQFLCNYASGNIQNQIHIWTLFQPLILYSLTSEDEKLQSYALMGVHICLSGQSNPIRQMRRSNICWDILHECVHLAVKDDAINGLLVIEDSLKLPGFCENVFPKLDNQLKILVLEVLINELQQIPDEGLDKGKHQHVNVPSMSNIEYLAAEFVIQSHRIPHMGGDSVNDTMAMYLVKELEGLCLASTHHSLYPCLQEMQLLVKVSIGLLQSIEDLGHAGNPVFVNAGKLSQLANVDQDHPVYGLKRDLICLLGNLAYRHKTNQDLIREQNGIPLILNKTNIDGKNPFIIQWSVLAIHNLTENNAENQQYITDLKLEGIANNQAVLEEMGLSAEKQGEKVVIKKKR